MFIPGVGVLVTSYLKFTLIYWGANLLILIDITFRRHDYFHLNNVVQLTILVNTG